MLLNLEYCERQDATLIHDDTVGYGDCCNKDRLVVGRPRGGEFVTAARLVPPCSDIYPSTSRNHASDGVRAERRADVVRGWQHFPHYVISRARAAAGFPGTGWQGTASGRTVAVPSVRLTGHARLTPSYPNGRTRRKSGRPARPNAARFVTAAGRQTIGDGEERYGPRAAASREGDAPS